MNTEQAKQQLKELQIKQYAFGYAESAIYLDSVTTAPKETSAERGVALSVLSEESYKLFVNDEVKQLLDHIAENPSEFSWEEKRQAEELKRSFDDMTKIPMNEFVEYSVLVNDAQSAWHKAKETSDYALFKPYLEKIVETRRRFAGYFDPEKDPYDVWLDKFERGVNKEILDKYFAEVRSVLVPLIKNFKEKAKIDDSFLFKTYPIDKQREFSDYLMQVMGIDRNHCAIGETEHPFTLNFNSNDVRITTKYLENNVASSMYSVIHEGGHALYELGVDPKFNCTALAGGSSMGLHESQSRLYENMIGRSLPFIEYIFPKMKEIFPEQLEGVDAKKFWLAVNKAEPSLIRTEADELTYSLHIIIRYELEKQLIAGTLSVDELPEAWNRLYKEYLGVDVPDDKHGVLQDSHWSGGSLGYFPSYSLGSAYAAQMIHCMEQEFDVWKAVSEGKIGKITEWLGEKIHRHGCSLKPNELLQNAIGKFDAKYYTDYLAKKFNNIAEIAEH